MDYSRDIKCAVCDKGFTQKSWEDHHDFHEKDCPNFKVFDDLNPFDNNEVDCDCELVAHDKCCPQCHPKRAQRIMENKVLKNIREENNNA
jgi:hypothetical protein